MKWLKQNFWIFKTNLKQLLCSKEFISAFFLLMLIELIAILERDGVEVLRDDYSSVTNLIFYMTIMGFVVKLIFLVSSMPVATGFCTDWNTQYIKPVIGRMGVNRYLIHKVIICVVGSFLAIFLSLVMMSLILLMNHPLAVENDWQNYDLLYPFGYLIHKNIILHWFSKLVFFSAYYAVWSVSGLAISAYIPNRFIACALPIGFEHFFSRLIFSTAEPLPNWLYIPYIATGFTNPITGNIYLDVLYMTGVLLLFVLVFGTFFYIGAKRKIRNESV